jgi:hypothetical protein
MREYMNQWAVSWLSQMEPIIKTIVYTYFANTRNCLSRADVQAVLESSQAIRKLKNEATEHLVVLANISKVVFFQLIKHYVIQQNANLATLSLGELGLSQVPNNFDRLAESIKMACEEIQEDIQDNKSNASSSENLVTLVQGALQEKLKALVNSVFVDPTIKLTSAFLESCRNRPQLATMSAFKNEDTALKRAIFDFNVSTHNKKSTEFLLDQLRKTVIDMLTSNPDDKELLRFAIKFGFPLPLAAAKPIADAAHSIFAQNKYGTGFWVLIFAKDADVAKDKPILKFATKNTAKMEVQLRCDNNQFFLCRADFIKYSGDDNINGRFFYESLMEKMRHLRGCFPKHEISFRELIIQNI